jgi:formylglycine-generating enzyme required for sulfatase activity
MIKELWQMNKDIGDYTIIKQIGRGALGDVFLAEHRFMKKKYALKVLPQELAADRGFIQRFEGDIERISSLEHPNIVKVHNISHVQDKYFLVTDCIVDNLGETTNLAHYMSERDEGLDEDELMMFLKQIAGALDYAHSQKRQGAEGFVHGDLKLNNILVGRDGGKPKVFISDFGLSRIIGTSALLSRMYAYLASSLEIQPVAENKTLHEDKYAVGNYDMHKVSKLHSSFLQHYLFLAPEQKRAHDTRLIDYKSDIYSFGVLAYYLMTKGFPEGAFEYPSQMYGKYNKSWDNIIFQCLQKNPQRRPNNIMSLLGDTTAKDVSQYTITMPEEKKSERQEQRTVSTAKKKEKIAAVNKEEEIEEQECSVAVATQEVEEVEDVEVTEDLKPHLHQQQIERPQYDPDPAQSLYVDGTVKQYHPEPAVARNVTPLLTDMVVIKGGESYRGSQEGSRDEMPRHKVTTASFAIDVHPIANEQFVRFLEFMGGEKDGSNRDIIRLRESRIKRRSGRLVIESGYAKHPVVGVTWYGAIAYAQWVGKRLPFETEWEVAAKAGYDNSMYPTGGEIEKFQANYFSSDTTAVMSYAPNENGLYDIAGNVYEWCQDWYDYNYYEVSSLEPDNPHGPLQGVYRVLRGGCWKSLKEDLRCSHRHRNNPGTVNRTYGFRCAADVH